MTEPTPDDETARELVDAVLTPSQQSLITGATAAHNVFLAYLQAGFDKHQALALTAQIVAVSTRWGLENQQR